MRKRILKAKQKKEILVIKQNNRCYYCNCKFDECNYETLDHYKPYCEVWNNTNYVLACRKCNLYKWNISAELFMAWYICFNIKPWFNKQSYNQAIKVRNPIRWYNKLFPNILNWNNKYYNLTIKLYVKN